MAASMKTAFSSVFPGLERYQYLYPKRELGKRARELKQLCSRDRAFLRVSTTGWRKFGVANATTMRQTFKA